MKSAYSWLSWEEDKIQNYKKQSDEYLEKCPANNISNNIKKEIENKIQKIFPRPIINKLEESLPIIKDALHKNKGLYHLFNMLFNEHGIASLKEDAYTLMDLIVESVVFDMFFERKKHIDNGTKKENIDAIKKECSKITKENICADMDSTLDIIDYSDTVYDANKYKYDISAKGKYMLYLYLMTISSSTPTTLPKPLDKLSKNDIIQYISDHNTPSKIESEYIFLQYTMYFINKLNNSPIHEENKLNYMYSINEYINDSWNIIYATNLQARADDEFYELLIKYSPKNAKNNLSHSLSYAKKNINNRRKKLAPQTNLTMLFLQFLNSIFKSYKLSFRQLISIYASIVHSADPNKQEEFLKSIPDNVDMTFSDILNTYEDTDPYKIHSSYEQVIEYISKLNIALVRYKDEKSSMKNLSYLCTLVYYLIYNFYSDSREWIDLEKKHRFNLTFFKSYKMHKKTLCELTKILYSDISWNKENKKLYEVIIAGRATHIQITIYKNLKILDEIKSPLISTHIKNASLVYYFDKETTLQLIKDMINDIIQYIREIIESVYDDISNKSSKDSIMYNEIQSYLRTLENRTKPYKMLHSDSDYNINSILYGDNTYNFFYEKKKNILNLLKN